MKHNLKIITMMTFLSIVIIGMFGIYAHAMTGRYATLNGSCSYDAAAEKQYAHAASMNISNTTRYIAISLKTTNGQVITSNERNVGYNTSIETGYVDVQSYGYVYAYAVIYNSATPSSGTAETLSLTLK